MVHHCHGVLSLIGLFLLFTGLKMLFTKEDEGIPEENAVMRCVRKAFPVTRDLHGQQFFLKAGGDWAPDPPVPGAAMIPNPLLESGPAENGCSRRWRSHLMTAIVALAIAGRTGKGSRDA